MLEKRKKIIFSVLTILVLIIAGTATYYWYQNDFYVSTDDAKLNADIARVSPQIAGKLIELHVEEGQQVKEGAILGRQEMYNIPDNNVELSLLRAPIYGEVIKVTGLVGEVIAPGQAVALIVNPKKVFVTANIEETKLGRLKIGQKVELNIDTFDGIPFTGTVDTLGKASSATFSLLPSGSSGNFTKVIQKVPVKLRIDDFRGYSLLPGISVEVKIHIK